jgi:hypothetical protein
MGSGIGAKGIGNRVDALSVEVIKTTGGKGQGCLADT